MGHFFELMLELIFGFAKGKPDTMPSIKYKDTFAVRHSVKMTLARICLTLVLIIVFSLLWMFIKHETRFLFAIFAGLGIILFFLSLHSLSFKCIINENLLCWSHWGMFQKKILWENIICLKTLRIKDERAIIIALYDQNGKCIVDFNTDMQNAWYIVKMAEHKSIKIIEEKDLSLKQLRHI